MERSFFRDDLKVMYDEQADASSLFDVASDTMESVDIADRRLQTATAMGAELGEMHRTLREDSRRRSAATADEETTRDCALERRLALRASKSLGYVGE